jgi:hypothetical protein
MVCFRSGDALSLLGDVLRYSRRVDFPCKSTVLRLTSLVTSRSRNRPANSAGHAIRFYGECIGKVQCYESGIRYPAESSLETGSNMLPIPTPVGSAPCARAGSPLVPDSRTAPACSCRCASKWDLINSIFRNCRQIPHIRATDPKHYPCRSR